MTRHISEITNPLLLEIGRQAVSHHLAQADDPDLPEIERRQARKEARAISMTLAGLIREGLKLACDQYYVLHREKEQPGAWLENEESRYTPYQHVGSESAPGLLLNGHGPHFEGCI